MNETATSIEPAPSASPLSESDQYYRDRLREMTEIGGMLLRMVFSDAAAMRRACKDDPGSVPFPLPDHSDAYDTYCRAMRRNMLMDRSLEQPAAKPAVHSTRPAAIREASPVREAACEHDRPETPQTTGAERPERAEPAERPEMLDRPDTLEDDSGRPRDEVIAEIRQDLGLTHKPTTPPANSGVARPTDGTGPVIQLLGPRLHTPARDRFGQGPPAPNIPR